MTIKYVYNNKNFNTQEEAEAEVLVIKNRLDNYPTDWVIMKQISQNEDGTWEVPAVSLDDVEINNLEENGMYQVHCPYNGENLSPLTAAEATAKVNEFRSVYANWLNVTKILKMTKVAATETTAESRDIVEITTEEDMSGYI